MTTNRIKNIVIFTGAGASAYLGKPTTAQFISELSNNKWTEFSHIIDIYRKHTKDDDNTNRRNAIVDSEYLRDWFLHIRKSVTALEQLSPYKLFEPHITVSKNGSQLIDRIIEKFDGYIRELYGEVDSDIAYNHYSPLLQTLESHGFRSIPVFTTNYDLVFEGMIGHDANKWHIDTGEYRLGQHTYFDAKLIDKVTVKPLQISLFKLHGSTNWWRDPDSERIELVPTNHNPNETYQELLIYPTREKFEEVSNEPFSLLYKKLEEYLSINDTLCIAIGYSFRDRIINEKFSNGMKKGLRLLVLDSDPQRKQLREEFKKAGLEDNEISAKLHIESLKFGGWRDNPNNHNRLKEIISEQLLKTP